MTDIFSPDFLGPPLPTPQEMAEWDALSFREFSIPETLLMENAAREAFHAIREMLPPRARILVIMGGGNNGGDGACLARHLRDAGCEILVLHAKPLDQLEGTAKEHTEIARKTGVRFVPIPPDIAPDIANNAGFHAPPECAETLARPDMVVDALLGTGFSGQARERELVIIRYINAFHGKCPIVSLDVPSGLNALSGLPAPEAVRADMTVSFEAAKIGLAYPHAAEYTGRLIVREIGIPKAARSLHPASFRLLAPALDAWPPASPCMHKGTAGRVTIFGGSPRFTGAPALAALGALRAGAGLVTIACPGGIEPQIKSGFPEIMSIPLGSSCSWDSSHIPDCLKILRDLPHAAAVVIGPGMGREPQTMELVAALVAEKQRPPIILDADGLIALDSPETLAALHENDCITPHPGEAARILATSVEDVQAARVEALRALTQATRATVVLKGAGTLIGHEGLPIFLAPFAAPSLATGGSGDVLSGVISAHTARMRAVYPYTFSRHDAFHAAALGVFVHGRAGEILDGKYPQRGALAREIADTIPHVPRT